MEGILFRYGLGALVAGIVVSGTVAEAQPRALRIALVAKSEANFVFHAARRGAEDRAAALSKQHGARIEVLWLTPPKEDPAQQVESIRKAVAQRADAILVSASDAATLLPAVNDAVAQGVEVMTFDSDVPGSHRFAFFGADDDELGAKVAGDLADLLGDKGEVAILAGSAAAGNLRSRAEGVRKALAQKPGIEVLGIVNHPETPQEAVTAMLKFGAAHPKLAGWAMVGGWPLFRSSQSPALVSELQTRGLKVVAVDALPEQLVYVERGLVPVLWAQPLYDWGAIGVSTIVDKVLLKKAVPRSIRMELMRVTREGMPAYARRLASWGFTVPREYLGS
jgi:ribose transport system substrate-binding protein